MSRVFVTLSFWSDSTDAAAMSRTAGLNPDRVRENESVGQGVETSGRRTLWELSSPLDPARCLEEHLEALLNRALANEAGLLELSKISSECGLGVAIYV